MPIQFVDTDGTLVIPQAAAKWQTAPSNAGIATRGVVLLLGEAETGASYSEETDNLSAATFGPGQFSSVQAKYASGNLVDAFRVVANASRDPAIRGAPTQIICVKTNTGTKSQVALTGGYGVFEAKNAGSLGNLISVQVSAAATEVPPSLSFGYLYNTGSETIRVAANGGTSVALTLTAATPALFVSGNAAALLAQNITLSGGVNYKPAAGLVLVTAAVAAADNVITITLSGGTWATTPTAGQILQIDNGSSITGAANANSGQYYINSATASGLVATKCIDLDGSTLTPPVVVAPGATADAAMCDSWTNVVFTNTAADVAGLGKSLTFYRSSGSAVSHFIRNVAVVSASIYTYSTTEAASNILVNRSSDSLSETFRVGGNVAVAIGHVGTSSAPVTVSQYTIDLNGTTLTKASFATLGDVVAYINAQPNWYATVAAAYRSLPPSVLDYGVFDANQNDVTSTGPARIKKDAYDTVTAIAGSRGVEFATEPTAGIPAVQAVTFMSGGAKGGTTDAAVEAALVVAGLTRCNFVVPLFSRDATSDIADGLTDATSTYTIDGINAYVAAHVYQYSQFKKRRPRQALCSKQDTFSAVKTAAQTLANERIFFSFLDISTIGSNGTQWFQPWMGSALAAGMQAAAFYRPIFNKSIAAYGSRQLAGDFSTQDDDAVEEALLAGLGVIRAREGGGYGFVSDQNSYVTDDNFVLNSLQAVYAADVVAMTVAQRMERAFVGQSFADITAAAALSFLKGIMADLKRLKLICASDDAVDGYKDATIEIQPPAMLVYAEIKLATGLYFVPIKFLVTEVQQTASQG